MDHSERLDISEAESSEFTWDSLPEVIKERFERIIDYSTTTEVQLAKAKASREQAEVERQRTAKHILANAKEAGQAVVSNARKTLDDIKVKTEEAELKRDEAKRLLAEAKTVRAEADAYRDAVLARTDQQAEEILQRSRDAAEAEQARLAKHVSFEAERMLAQAEAMRAAALEELEAQRIYTEAARLKADAHEALDHLKAQLEVTESVYYGNGGEGANGNAGQSLPSDTLKNLERVAENLDKLTQSQRPQEVADSVIAVIGGGEGPSEASATEIGSVDATFESDATEEPSPSSSPNEGGPLDPQQSDDPAKARARNRRIKTS